MVNAIGRYISSQCDYFQEDCRQNSVTKRKTDFSLSPGTFSKYLIHIMKYILENENNGFHCYYDNLAS